MPSKSKLSVVLAAMATFALPFAAQAQYVFWSQSNGTIWRAELDGTGATQLATGQTFTWSMTADRGTARLYWAPWGSQIRGINFDGTGLTNIQTLPHDYGEGIAVDPASGNVYFNYWNPNGVPGSLGGGINYAKSDGSEAPSGAHHLYDGSAVTADTGLGIDHAAGMIYEGRSTTVYKAPLDGSGTLASMSNVTTPYLFGLALDPPNNKMYWTSADIRVANMDGTGTTTILPITGLATNPHGIAVDSLNQMIYFVQDGDGGSIHSGVYRVPTTGGAATLLIDLQGIDPFPRGLALAAPEPASAGLLALSGVLVLSRRRK